MALFKGPRASGRASGRGLRPGRCRLCGRVPCRLGAHKRAAAQRRQVERVRMGAQRRPRAQGAHLVEEAGIKHRIEPARDPRMQHGAIGRRAVTVEYLRYNTDGTMKPVVQTEAGVSVPSP